MTLTVLLIQPLEIFPSSLRERTRNLYSYEKLRHLCNAGDRILPNLIKNTLMEKCRPGYRMNSKEKKKKQTKTQGEQEQMYQRRRFRRWRSCGSWSRAERVRQSSAVMQENTRSSVIHEHYMRPKFLCP